MGRRRLGVGLSRRASKMHHTMSRWRTCLLVTACTFVASWGSGARGAQAVIDAPPACLDSASLADEVGILIGRPLAGIADVDFRIRIAQTPRGRWLLRLETVDQAARADGTRVTRGTREIDGATCAELAEAAAVAIAVSVRSIETPTVAPAGPDGHMAPGTVQSEAPSKASAAVASSRTALSWRPAMTVALVTDTGTLPSTAPGVDLEGNLQRGSFRLTLLGAWFVSRDVSGAGGIGGTFQLAFGGALSCLAPTWGRWTPLTCAGLEVGRLAGTGVGVARPETGAALWRAARAELGVRAVLGGSAAVVLRAGVAIPLERPAFVLDQSELVYQPSRMAVRATAGIELGF